MFDIYLLNKNKNRKKTIEKLENEDPPIENIIQDEDNIEELITPSPVITTDTIGDEKTEDEELIEKPSQTPQPVIEQVIEITESIKTKPQNNIFNIIILITMILLNIYAAVLSWSCNRTFHFIPRAIFALFAFSFGIVYIILHLIFRESLNPCRENFFLF